MIEPRYDARAVEGRRQREWRASERFRTPPPTEGRRDAYVKSVCPFTSGHIHVGHVRSYTIGDAYARWRRMCGDAVLFSIGFDAFGLPAELAAIGNEEPPADWVERSYEHMLDQFERMGFSFDWERVFVSSDEEQYRWSQWLFLTFLEAGLLYQEEANVDWCDSCQTTLASLQVENGRCWRCNGPARLIRRKQWFLRISAYLEENERGIEAHAERWDKPAVTAQRAILGRVDGAEVALPRAGADGVDVNLPRADADGVEVDLPRAGADGLEMNLPHAGADGVEMDLPYAGADGAVGPAGRALTCFTEHPGALGQARFVMVSPRHPDLEGWVSDPAVLAELDEIRQGGWQRGDRSAESVPATNTGVKLTAPNGAELPLVISPAVDGRYGPTAVLGIPAADESDGVIARRLGLGAPAIPVPGRSRPQSGRDLPDAEGETSEEMPGQSRPQSDRDLPDAEGEAGEALPGRSRPQSGRDLPDAEGEAGEEEMPGGSRPQSDRDLPGDAEGGGKVPRPAVRYRAGDFAISRQRSWGAPIPMVHCESCGIVPVGEDDLPVRLPRDLKPTGEGNPLAEREDFMATTCPDCGGDARRETDTLDCHFDDLWMWLPTCVPKEDRERQMFDHPECERWLPGAMLIHGADGGGYFFDQRITAKALRDAGPLAHLAGGEQFGGAVMHEMVTQDGRKMSKHLGNVVDPDELMGRVGADTTRLAVLYGARPSRALNWTENAVQYCARFLDDLWRYAAERLPGPDDEAVTAATDPDGAPQRRERLESWCATAAEKVTEDLEKVEMQRAVKNTMRLFDRIKDFEAKSMRANRGDLAAGDAKAIAEALTILAQLLTPFAPHVGEELWLATPDAEPGEDAPWPHTRSPQLAAS